LVYNRIVNSSIWSCISWKVKQTKGMVFSTPLFHYALKGKDLPSAVAFVMYRN
jgi:hypothetical protein